MQVRNQNDEGKMECASTVCRVRSWGPAGVIQALTRGVRRTPPLTGKLNFHKGGHVTNVGGKTPCWENCFTFLKQSWGSWLSGLPTLFAKVHK